jgi:hypothetical protein
MQVKLLQKMLNMTFQEQPSGEYLNGMLDTILLLTQRVRPGKDPDCDQAAQELMALIMDLKTCDLMERLAPAWAASSPAATGAVHASR